MDSQHVQRAADNAKYLALYENLDNYIPGAPAHMQNRFGSKLSLNVIKSCTDSVAAEIATARPKPEFVTTDGDYRLQKKAELLTQYMDGVFYDNKVYTDHGPDIFKDAALFGTGALAVINDGERIKYERTLIDEIYVDEYDGLYRKPKSLMHVRRVFRDTLKERFQDDPKALQAIDDAPDASQLGSNTDMIMVAEAWYLPSKLSAKAKAAKQAKSKDGKSVSGVSGGRYAVCLENYDLFTDEYTKDYFPFVFFRWNNRRTGFLGQGLAEELVPLQLEIARTLTAIQRGMRLTGLRIFLEEGSQVNPNHLDEDGSKGVPITKYVGTPPVTATWAANSPEIYQYLENLYRKAFEITGVSNQMAFAQKPAGITAAKALETLNDNQSKRFKEVGDRYEQFYLELAELTIDQSRDLYESNTDLSIKTITDGFLAEVKWKDVDMDNDRFKMKAFPVNMFSDSPAARLQQITAAMEAGWLTQERAEQLLEMVPDFKSEVSLKTASLQRVSKDLDSIKHEGKYNPPDIYLDTKAAVIIAQSELNRSMNQGVEEDKLQMIRNYIDDLQNLQGLSAPPPPAAPMAQPMAAPTSDMLPINAPPGGQPPQ